MNMNPGKMEFTKAEHDALRGDVRAVIEGGLSQATIGREAEIPSASLSQYLSDKYPNETGKAEIANKLHRWLAQRAAASEIRRQLPVSPAFIPLVAARKISNVLAIGREAGRMVLIGGVPGTSKTAACLQFQHDNPRTWFASMDPTTSGVPTMLLEILDAMGVSDMKGTPQVLMREICNRAKAGKGLIVVDEAQHLSDKALEALRAINDRVRKISAHGIGIALVGNELAQSRVAATGQKADFAQVSSRLARRLWLKTPEPQDAADLATAWAAANSEVIGEKERAFCQSIAARPGGLRNIEMTMEGAIIAARGADSHLTLAHLQGAFARLSGDGAAR